MKTTVKIPREIGEFIEYCKYHNITLYEALCLTYDFSTPSDRVFKGDISKCVQWARKNSNDFACAWVNGYEVDEKYYYIAVPCGNDTYRRAFVDSGGKLIIGNFTYSSKKDIAKISKDASVKLTEKVIKESELAWVWQFAKELGI